MKNIIIVSRSILESLAMVLLSSIEFIWSLINLFLNSNNTNLKSNTMEHNWTLQILGLIGMFLVIFYLLLQYHKIKRKMKVYNIISQYRSYKLYMNQFSNSEYYRAPNESDEQFFNRLPEGQYREELKGEYKEVKQLIINELDLYPSIVEEILDDAYKIKRSKK